MAKGDDHRAYCSVQMPVAQGRELLQVVNSLRDSGAYPNLDTVFAHMQFELKMSIAIVEKPPNWGVAEPTKH
ncbi:hypothetical protein [Pseudomonas moraviensis]|uniref:hypothetical protein n=1 Tax=Pseudomonas moraviensis TaxID=321662 RepID=UPI000937B4B3|nr:hypothetical protein [Pseudomonas moraviensis]OJT48404.1 hypothetical protein BSZ28_26380 [Pseudomonas moraviensis]